MAAATASFVIVSKCTNPHKAPLWLIPATDILANFESTKFATENFFCNDLFLLPNKAENTGSIIIASINFADSPTAFLNTPLGNVHVTYSNIEAASNVGIFICCS